MWCKKTKALLDELEIEYKYLFVDLLENEEKEKAKQEVIKWKKKAYFPLIVIDNKKAITSFDEEKIRKELG
jgi:glutaredoxin